jgi:hypothetical protein
LPAGERQARCGAFENDEIKKTVLSETPLRPFDSVIATEFTSMVNGTDVFAELLHVPTNVHSVDCLKDQSAKKTKERRPSGRGWPVWRPDRERRSEQREAERPEIRAGADAPPSGELSPNQVVNASATSDAQPRQSQGRASVSAT